MHAGVFLWALGGLSMPPESQWTEFLYLKDTIQFGSLLTFLG